MIDDSGEPPTQTEGRHASRASSWAFWVTLAAFLVASIALALANRSPGSADSCANLTLARNIVEGRGYVSFGVGQLWEPQPIPSPETIKPPGLAYLTAALFALFGTSLAIPVIINALAVSSNAILLRMAVSWTSGIRLGNVVGLLILLSRNQELVSLWNNNILAACHSFLMMLSAVGRRGPGKVVALAVVSSIGFLMKPTFLLGAVPFAVLVLGCEAGVSRARRTRAVLGFLALFVALTAPYWLVNLLRHGDPLYAPGFTSGRLAVRYDVLGAGTWRTVRFSHPMTYGEVARVLGVPAMLFADARMIATTTYHAIALNPAVVLMAVVGLLLFRRADRWRDYAGPAVLASAVGFEVGIYNHHEFRYLWPIFPCTLALAALAARDFWAWGLPRMASDLAGRFRLAFLLAWATALGFGILGGAAAWRNFIREARAPIPSWVASVSQLPADAVILVADAPSVGWWTGRSTVICPAGARDGLITVVALYHADHYLSTEAGGRPASDVPFRPDELTLIARGDNWGLYRITAPIALGGHPTPGDPRRVILRASTITGTRRFRPGRIQGPRAVGRNPPSVRSDRSVDPQGQQADSPGGPQNRPDRSAA